MRVFRTPETFKWRVERNRRSRLALRRPPLRPSQLAREEDRENARPVPEFTRPRARAGARSEQIQDPDGSRRRLVEVDAPRAVLPGFFWGGRDGVSARQRRPVQRRTRMPAAEDRRAGSDRHGRPPAVHELRTDPIPLDLCAARPGVQSLPEGAWPRLGAGERSRQGAPGGPQAQRRCARPPQHLHFTAPRTARHVSARHRHPKYLRSEGGPCARAASPLVRRGYLRPGRGWRGCG